MKYEKNKKHFEDITQIKKPNLCVKRTWSPIGRDTCNIGSGALYFRQATKTVIRFGNVCMGIITINFCNLKDKFAEQKEKSML